MAANAASGQSVLGRYQVTEQLAAGAFGRVLKVVDAQTSEVRALKVSARGDGMLLDEFAQLARLQHPSLPRVFEVGRTGEAMGDVPAGAPFFIAEWIAGGRADERRWDDPSKLWSLLADVAGALAAIHAAGLVHGDVSPANVLLVDGGARAVLVDLGLSNAEGARGTPEYMAPEAFAGVVDARSDVYSLGATAVRLVTGRPMFEAPTLGELVQKIVAAKQAPALPALPRPLADLIARMVSRDADRRPASALAVLDELDQLASALAPDQVRRARPKVGMAPRTTAWPGAAETIDAIARGLADGASVQLIVAEPALGGRDLAESAVRRWQLDEVARGRQPGLPMTGTLDAVAARLACTASVGAEPRRWIEGVARAIATGTLLVVCELGEDPRAELFIAALARAPLTRPVIVIADGKPANVPAEVLTRVLAPLDVEGVRGYAASMLGAEPPRAWAESLASVSGGLPLTVAELVQSLGDVKDPFAVEWRTRSSATAEERRAKQIAALSPAARRLLVAIAAHGGNARADRVLAAQRALPPEAGTAAAARAGDAGARSGDAAERAGDAGDAAGASGLGHIVELEHAGLLRRRGDDVTIDRATCEAALATAADGELAAIAEAALGTSASSALASSASALLGSPASAARGSPTQDSLEQVATLLMYAPLSSLAARACDVAEQLLARGLADRARRLAERAMGERAQRGRAGLIAARAAAAQGAYREVETLARAAEEAGADRVLSRLVVARAAQRSGDLDAAEAMLSELHARHPEHVEIAGTYARLLVTRARFADARRVATAGGPLAGLRAEAAGLAAFYSGELDDADRAFAALEVGAAADGDAATIGRALSLRGMVAQQRGQLGLASDRYREAARRLDEAGEVHAAAVAELNLGTVLTERGRASDALPRLAAASRVFAQLGATTELIAADLNRGNALLALGQFDDVHAAATSALRHADGAPHLRAFALLVLGDALRRRGDEAGAERAYRDALAIGKERADAQAQLSAYIQLAEAGHRVDADVEALCTSDDERDRWTLARGRLALLERTPPGAAELVRLAHACGEIATRAADADRLERAYRGALLAALLAQAAREVALARGFAERARAAHAALVAATAPAFRSVLVADPDLARLPAASDATALLASAPWHRDEGPNLRRLLTLSRRLNSEANVERILDEVIDTAIELTSAERGFLLLRQADGELAPVVSRNFAMSDLASGDRSVSRSIAERAAQTGEPVVTVDAGIDERFAVAASVAALRLRSVLVVPLRQRGTITGCIYVDHRLRGGAFDEAAASLLGELADIAAIAIENARLTNDLRRTTHEVDELNRRLSAELAEREAELVRAKADLPDRDRLRNRYEAIIGRSPAMVRMLDVLDRAAATSLPVVIVGESGTGKELVARALHDHGPRRDGAFVAINCSAVPEPLLESELFGHVRGAFTGADRDRRGLFEVADGGTLFLDEVADTSPAMQAKLLRVLQDGMIRRVGDTKTRKVDVRVVTATQRSLAELAAGGTFREDLRFRLEVISIPVPPLRERDGDVPLLVEQLLAHLCRGRTAPRLTRAALRALGQHRWPGNVRELENALARGLAMGGDVIDIVDLPEAVAASAARPEPAKPSVGDDLRLKPALNATEQAYITAAMNRAKGNQTVAARLLGLSRFGLQKKLRRLSGEDDGGSDEP